MYPQSPKIEIGFGTLAPLGRLCYYIDGQENNPSLQLVRGYTYELNVNAPAQHQLWIKEQLGSGSNGSYNLGVRSNGTAQIFWRVANSTPSRLLYQSFSSTFIAGSIEILDVPPALPKGVDSFADLSRALDDLERLVVRSPQELAGPGLKLVGTALTLLDPDRRYLTATDGSIYSTQSSFSLSSTRVPVGSQPQDLSEHLDLIAAIIARIKGTSDYQSVVAPQDSLQGIKGRLDNLALEVDYIQEQLIEQSN